jgi:hypothetical protein
VTKSKTTILTQIKTLPNVIQQIIFEYDDTYRKKFNGLIWGIKKMFEPEYPLQFKKKYQKFFGYIGSYAIVHQTYRDDIRISSIQPEYDGGCNSVLYRPHKILLFMEESDNRENFYDDDLWRRCRNLYNRITEACYGFDFDDDSNSESEQDHDF